MTARPTMLPQTGELDRLHTLADAQVEASRHTCTVQIEADTLTRSGFVAYFPYAEQTYSLSTLMCACAGITIALAADGTAREYINAAYTCATHGTHQSTAIRCATTPQHKPNPIFGWVEQRHARDSRVQWGMTQRRTP